MYEDPAREWQRLRDHYRELGEIELCELAADFGNLTETAQQALTDEMKSRSLEVPQEKRMAPIDSSSPELQPWGSGRAFELESSADSPFDALGAHPRLFGRDERTEQSEAEGEGEAPSDYTWKTELCECDEPEEAWQIYEVLRRASVESWIERPRSYLDPGGYKVLVAADQLDQAREIADRPIPKEVVELSKMKEPEYLPPVCPSCGAEDPVLEDVEPCNSWKCEACGRHWTEAAEVESREAPGN